MWARLVGLLVSFSPPLFSILSCHPADRGSPILPLLVSFSLPPSAKPEGGGHYGCGMMGETGQGRIRCHGPFSGIIEIGSSHVKLFDRWGDHPGGPFDL